MLQRHNVLRTYVDGRRQRLLLPIGDVKPPDDRIGSFIRRPMMLRIVDHLVAHVELRHRKDRCGKRRALELSYARKVAGEEIGLQFHGLHRFLAVADFIIELQLILQDMAEFMGTNTCYGDVRMVIAAS